MASNAIVTAVDTPAKSGLMSSTTVTVAVAVDELPCTSVTVRVTVLLPTDEQSKLVISSAYELISQLSLEPLSISEGWIVAKPAASKETAMSCAIAVGATLSRTITSSVTFELLPYASNIVNVTWLLPTSEQSK